MQTFDIIAIAVYSLFIAIGIYRGFIKEVFQIAAMLGGFTGAYLTYPILTIKLSFISDDNSTVTVLAFILAFVICFFIILAIGWAIKKIVHMTPLGMLDRVIGGFSGFIKASILLILFCLSMNALPDFKLKEAFSNSISFKVVEKLPFVLKGFRSNKVENLINSVTDGKAAEKLKNFKKHSEIVKKGSKALSIINNGN